MKTQKFVSLFIATSLSLNTPGVSLALDLFGHEANREIQEQLDRNRVELARNRAAIEALKQAQRREHVFEEEYPSDPEFQRIPGEGEYLSDDEVTDIRRHRAAEAYQSFHQREPEEKTSRAEPPTTDTTQASEEDTAAAIGTAILGGLLLYWFLGGSGSETSSTENYNGGGNDDDFLKRLYKNEEPSLPSASPPDTSAGCAWGDRAYGTCH